MVLANLCEERAKHENSRELRMIASELLKALRSAHKVLHRQSDAQFASLDVTADQFVLLATLAGSKALTQKKNSLVTCRLITALYHPDKDLQLNSTRRSGNPSETSQNGEGVVEVRLCADWWIEFLTLARG